MNEAILEQKLEALRHFPSLSASSIQRFGSILRQLSGWSLFRINPLRFAEQHALAPGESVDLFLHALKIGMVDLSFQTFCPLCGSAEYSHSALDQISTSFFCSICDGSSASDLDDHILVSFNINPSIATIEIDPYTNLESYVRYFFSDVLEYAIERQLLVQQQLRGFAALHPGQSWELTLEAEPGATYRAVSLELHAAVFFAVDAPASGAPTADIPEIDLLPGGFAPSHVSLAPGTRVVRFRNRLNQPIGIYLHLLDEAAHNEVMASHPNRWRSYFSAKMLLNSQAFRELFRVHQLASDLRLNIQSLTLLFSDLKDSTRLYGEVGDAFAYNLVREHFDLLTRAVREHSGAVVKTMGDAVMATFNDPLEGVRAALAMLHSIDALNQRIAESGYKLELKLGLHEGPALVVSADERLDYFGQSVNVAARVQSLAQPGELWMSETVHASPGVEPLLEQAGYRAEPHSALLKGVAAPTQVYRCEQGSGGSAAPITPPSTY